MECGAGSGCSAIVCNPEYNCRALSAMLVQEAAEVQGWPPTLHQWGVEGGLGKRVLHQKVHQNQWRVEAYKRQRHQHHHYPPSRVVTQKDIDTRLLFQKLVSHKAAPRKARKRDNIGDQKNFWVKISNLSRFSGYWRYLPVNHLHIPKTLIWQKVLLDPEFGKSWHLPLFSQIQNQESTLINRRPSPTEHDNKLFNLQKKTL